MRAIVRVSIGAALLVACNALSGIGDFVICKDGEPCTSGTRSAANDGGTGTGNDGSATNTDAGIVIVDDGGVLPLACESGQHGCEGAVAAVCENGAWTRSPCAETCVAGACERWPSCRSASASDTMQCGADPKSCCDSKLVPGGTFARLNDGKLKATVSPFRLDLFEVTVGRFRRFVEAGAGIATAAPKEGAAAHPKILGSGWQAAWNGYLPASSDALRIIVGSTTWTPAPAANENLPITSVPWFVAFAFCAWDGARLPTLAEWTFAASGGDEQRVYPWRGPNSSNAPPDPQHAAFNCALTSPAYTCPSPTCTVAGASCPPDGTDCTDLVGGTCSVTQPCFGCGPEDIAKVGALAAGAGRFGQFDLAGNVAEYVLDATGSLKSPPVSCTDCAPLMGSDPRGAQLGGSDDFNVFVLNGGWRSTAAQIQNNVWVLQRWKDRSDTLGFRCARD